MPYQQLDSDRIVETVAVLAKRVKERFPAAGLNHVSQKLLEVARQAKQRSEQIDRPIVWVRVVSSAVILVLLVLMVGAGWTALHESNWSREAGDLIQVVEASLNNLFAIGVTIFFLVSIETRLKRRRALQAIHELRVISHIIDMHQLTKDPERLSSGRRNTPSSPKRTMTEFELNRYLDYCSEMLALVGKIAVLYVQHFPDEQSVSAVNEVENLTTSLARKIWQKIMILQSAPAAGHAAGPASVTTDVGGSSAALPATGLPESTR
ncbi:MAG: hypothetical protein R3B90_06450 [Planctomycetaceae bacterium]